MPRNVLVSAIIAGARRRVNDFVDMSLADDPELITYVDQAFGKYYDELVKADPDYFKSEASFNTVAGTKSYALGNTWFGTMHVDILKSSKYCRLPRLAPHERNDYFQEGEPVRHQIASGLLALYPTPNAVHTIRHTYIPVWTPITLSSQSIDGLLGNEDLIELELAVRMFSKEKDGDAPAGIIAERKDALERLREKAFMKNVVEAQIVGLNELDDRPYFDEGDYRR